MTSAHREPGAFAAPAVAPVLLMSISLMAILLMSILLIAPASAAPASPQPLEDGQNDGVAILLPADPMDVPNADEDSSMAQRKRPTPNAERPSVLLARPDLRKGATSDLTTSAAVGIQEIFTTDPNAANGGLTQVEVPGTRRPDLDTKLTLELQATEEKARFKGDFDNSLGVDIYARNPGLDRLSDHLSANALALLLPNTLSLDARAFATPVAQTNVGPLNSEQRVASTGPNGQSEALGYSVAPQLVDRFGSTAQATASVAQGAVYYLDQTTPSTAAVADSALAPAGNTQSTSGSIDVVSGPSFGRLRWDANGGQVSSYGSSRFVSRQAKAEADYWLSRRLMLIASVGGDTIKSSQLLGRNLDGLNWDGGFRLDMTPDVDVTLRGGRLYGRPSVTGSLQWAVGPRTLVTSALTDAVSTPSLRILDQLGAPLVTAPIDPTAPTAQLTPTHLPTSPLPSDQLALNQTVNRYRSFNLSASRTTGRTTTTITGFATLADTLSVLPGALSASQRSVGLSIQLSHRLTRDLTANIGGSYAVAHQLGVDDDVYRINSDLAWALGAATTLDIGASYLARLETASAGLEQFLLNSPVGGGSLHDLEVFVSLHRKF